MKNQYLIHVEVFGIKFDSCSKAVNFLKAISDSVSVRYNLAISQRRVLNSIAEDCNIKEHVKILSESEAKQQLLLEAVALLRKAGQEVPKSILNEIDK